MVLLPSVQSKLSYTVPFVIFITWTKFGIKKIGRDNISRSLQEEGISNHAFSISSCALLISRSQPKILRKIQKNLRGYIPTIPRFSHVCADADDAYSHGFLMYCGATLFVMVFYECERSPPYDDLMVVSLIVRRPNEI